MFKRDVRVTVGEGDERRELVFRLGINEMLQVQEDWGIKDDQAFLAAIDAPQSLARYRSMVRRALTKHQPELTEDQVGDIITELGMARMKQVMAQTVAWAFPDPDPTPPPPGKADAASPGPMPS